MEKEILKIAIKNAIKEVIAENAETFDAQGYVLRADGTRYLMENHTQAQMLIDRLRASGKKLVLEKRNGVFFLKKE